MPVEIIVKLIAGSNFEKLRKHIYDDVINFLVCTYQ